MPPNGSGNHYTQTQPGSLAGVREWVGALQNKVKENITVYPGSGVYEFPEPLVFEERNSGGEGLTGTY